MKKILQLWFIGLAAWGCMDVKLLDNMRIWDSATVSDTVFEETDSKILQDSESQLVVSTAVSDDTDSQVVSALPIQDTEDSLPPNISTTCMPEEKKVGEICITLGLVSDLVRFTTDEPAILSLDTDMNATPISSQWGNTHELLVFSEAQNLSIEISLLVKDINNNAISIDIPLEAKSGIPVVISEVLADCIGDEPDGEFVEIVNLGDTAIDMSGWMIDDNEDVNGDLIPDGTILEPRSVAVIASPGFVGQTGMLILLDSSIGSSGLKNSGSETIELYDADGTLVDAYQNQSLAPKEGQSYVRRFLELPLNSSNAWIAHPQGGQSPGSAMFIDELLN